MSDLEPIFVQYEGVDPIRNDARRSARDRLFPPDAACIVCGETNRFGLRRILERHHVAGEVNDPTLTATHCLTHHAIETEGQRERGVPLRRGERRTVLDQVIVVLKETALFLSGLAQSLLRWAAELERLGATLDRSYPAWRTLPEVTR